MYNLGESIASLFEIFGKGDERARLNAYYEFLKSYDEETICKRIQYLAGSSKFFPTVAEILEVCVPNLQTEMEKAWQKFLDNKGNCFRMKPTDIDQGDITNTMVQLLGTELCYDIEYDKLPFLKKEFERYYPLVKNGTFPIKSDHRNWTQLENNAWVQIPSDINKDRFAGLIEKVEQKQIESKQQKQIQGERQVDADGKR